jgi:hypothetical protein
MGSSVSGFEYLGVLESRSKIKSVYRAAVDHQFQDVNGRLITVSITGMAMSTGGRTSLSSEQQEQAATALLEMEVEQGRGVPERIVLNEGAMVRVAHRLGWPERV